MNTLEQKLEVVDEKLKRFGFPEADRANVERVIREVFAEPIQQRTAIVDFGNQSLFETVSAITTVYAEGLKQGTLLPRRLPISDELAERMEAEHPALERYR